MAIRVKHAVSGKTSGDIAFQTGKGQRRERDLRVAQQQAAEQRRLQAAAESQDKSLAARATEFEAGREDAEVERLDRLSEQERAREFTAERDVYSRAGRVEDLEFGRESTSIAGREAEERRAREFALAAKHKADGDERQYTVEQQRKKDAINSSRVKIDEGVANGTYTEFQAEQFHQELDKQELGLSKMWGPKKITPLDELKANTFTADNGTLMYYNLKTGKVEVFDGQITPLEKLEATEKEKTQQYDWDTAEKATAAEDALNRTKNIIDMANQLGITIPDAIERYDLINPKSPAQVISDKTGRPIEQVKADIAAAQQRGQQGSQPQGSPQPTGQPQQAERRLKLLEELPAEDQEAVLNKFRKAEAKRQKPRKGFSIYGGPAQGTKSNFVPMSEQQFIDLYNSDENFANDFKTELREGVAPATLKEATVSDKKAMYENYKTTVEPGEKLESKFRFEQLIEDDPEAIAFYFNLKKKVTEGASKVPLDDSIRPDGTAKDIGFLGELQLPDGKVATEYSISSSDVKVDGKEIDFPTLVPTLTQEEIDVMVNDVIPNNGKIPESIVRKAIAHARKRIKAGQSPFFSK
jgi:hypothetical protein